MVLRKLVSLAVPASVAVAAYLHAHAVGALVDASCAPALIAPFAEARAASSLSTSRSSATKSADTILDRNPFDHVTGMLRPRPPIGSSSDIDLIANPLSAPACDGVRAVIAVQSFDADSSFASLDVRGKRMLQKRGGEVDDMRVVYVAEDRVWLSRNGALCQARVFAEPVSTPTTAGESAPTRSALEREVASKVVKSGPNEFQVDRGAMNMILEAQTELMKTPLVPERDGDGVVGFRLVKIKAGSVLSTLGLETGDRLVAINGSEVANPERLLEVYARIRAGTVDRLTLQLVRNGKPTNIDYVVR